MLEEHLVNLEQLDFEDLRRREGHGGIQAAREGGRGRSELVGSFVCWSTTKTHEG